jgi:hypothetical protein
MKNLNFIKLFLITIFFFGTISSNSQNTYSQKNIYKWFDKIVGIENTGLFEGTEYKEKYRTIRGNHKFFTSSQYLTGNIVYNGQPYYDIKLRYDIYEDDLIANLQSNFGFSTLKLIKDKIESFSLNNQLFVKLSYQTDNRTFTKDMNGFYALLFKNPNLILYKKYKKTIKKLLDKSFVYYKFKNQNTYLIYFNNKYHKIMSKKELIALFPKHQEYINILFKNIDTSQNSKFDKLMIQLMQLVTNDITISQ